MGNPSTHLIATWHRQTFEDDRPDQVVPQLWFHHRTVGTVVADQLQGQRIGSDGRVHDVRCITFLSPHMPPHDNRFREPGQMRITLEAFEALAPIGQTERYAALFR